MRTPANRFFNTLLLFAFLALSAASADDHVVFERTRSGLGMRSPARSTEIWLSEQALYMNSGRLITIVRYDLQKRWWLSPQTKRFIEEPLDPPAPEKKDSVTIHRMGWSYLPVYDWIVAERQGEERVPGQPCKLIVAEGEADYASESIQFWVTDKVTVNIERFNEKVVATTADVDWLGVTRAYPGLKRLFIMKIIDLKSHPIAPDMTYETLVTKIETSAPPPNIYQVPDDYQKVKSFDELTN